jgi:hypothetical protein
MPLNKFETELKAAITLQNFKKEDFFDTPLRHGYIIVSAGGPTLYLLDLINYMHSIEQHIIKATSLTSLKEYDLDPKKISIRSTKDLTTVLLQKTVDLIDSGRMLRIEHVTLYLGIKEYVHIPKFVVKKEPLLSKASDENIT